MAYGDPFQCSEAVIGGIYDIKEEKREEAKEKGFSVYETEEAMLADPDIDVVLIATRMTATNLSPFVPCMQGRM